MSSLIPIGSLVIAKWPSTTNYYRARVIDHQDDQTYVVEFLDGTIVALPSKFVDYPEKFSRTTRKISSMHNEQTFFDRFSSMKSIFRSFSWVIAFLFVQFWFHSNFVDFHRNPFIVLHFLCCWFVVQIIFARFFPSLNDEQFFYIKESHPNLFYKHRSNSFSSFLVSSILFIIFRSFIPIKDLNKSFCFIILFAFGFVLTITFISLSRKFFPSFGTISTVDDDQSIDRPLFDIELFASIRLGIMLWPTLNFLILLMSIETNQRLSIRLVLSILFQTIYIVNIFLNETSMIRQSFDVLSSSSSFDTLFTNVCWVPFMSTLTTFYIGKSQRLIHPVVLICSTLTFLGGFLLQRAAMRERTSFQDRNDRHSRESILMNEHQRILISGCWRLCRNPHLLAEILMAIAWSMPAGFRHFSPWIYALYIIGTSLHKIDYFDKTLKKYSNPQAFRDYTNCVKYHLIPFIY